MGARSYWEIGIENPLSLPKGFVPVATLIVCKPGFAEYKVIGIPCSISGDSVCRGEGGGVRNRFQEWKHVVR